VLIILSQLCPLLSYPCGACARTHHAVPYSSQRYIVCFTGVDQVIAFAGVFGYTGGPRRHAAAISSRHGLETSRRARGRECQHPSLLLIWPWRLKEMAPRQARVKAPHLRQKDGQGDQGQDKKRPLLRSSLAERVSCLQASQAQYRSLSMHESVEKGINQCNRTIS